MKTTNTTNHNPSKNAQKIPHMPRENIAWVLQNDWLLLFKMLYSNPQEMSRQRSQDDEIPLIIRK